MATPDEVRAQMADNLSQRVALNQQLDDLSNQYAALSAAYRDLAGQLNQAIIDEAEAAKAAEGEGGS